MKKAFKIILKIILVIILLFSYVFVYALGNVNGTRQAIKNSRMTVNGNRIVIDCNGNVYEHYIDGKGN